MTRKKPVVVYGPQASGKTRNAAALLRRFGKRLLVDDWDGCARLPGAALALTNTEPPYAQPARAVAIADALRERVR